MKPDNIKQDEDGDNEPDGLSTIDDDGGLSTVDGGDSLLAQEPAQENVQELIKETVNGTTDVVDSLNASRRHRHNIKEKERKGKIKNDMEEMKSLLPPSYVSEKKQTMHELLQLGIRFIHSLKEQNCQLATSGGSNNCDELERLRTENEKLKSEVSQYASLLASAGISPDMNPSDLRPRNTPDMGNPFLFAQNGQQMAANMLQTATVDNGQHHPTDASSQQQQQQFNGQISYMSSDAPTASQFTMYTDLLNSSDPSSCMVMSANEQQGGLAQCMMGSGTSIVTHNGQLMLVSQPQVNRCHDRLSENQNQPTHSFEQVGAGATIDGQQFEDGGADGLELLNGNQGSGLAESDDANLVPVCASEPTSAGNDMMQMQHSDANDCVASVAQDSVAPDASKPIETQASAHEFFLGNVSSAQTTMAVNNAGLYTEYMNNSFEQQNHPSVASVAPVATDSVAVQNAGGDGQLQGQRLVLHNGQLLLVSSNQNMAQQTVGLSVSSGVMGQDYGGGFNHNPQMAPANLPIHSAANVGSAMFLNKPNQFGPQPVTFIPGHASTLPPNLLQAPLASNQTVTVNTPQGPMIMHTLPSQPNEHPQALILPNGAIVPVVTQPNLLFPPQQCIPVTGSLLVPSVTPSHMAQGLVTNPGHSHLNAKLMDSKGQTYAFSANPHMQLHAGMSQFANMVPQVLPGVDASKLGPSSSLQAVPAQGHLPLPSFQPGSAASKPAPSRSKKKPASASAAIMKPSPLPQLQGSLMMTQNGQFILVPSNEGALNPPPAAGHAKPAQRVLMPKPMPKMDAVMSHPMPVTQQIAGVTAITRAPLLSASCSASVTVPPFMAPLTISVPLTCAPVPVVCTTPNDLLAQAAESLFTVSPSHRQAELHTTDSHQLLVNSGKTMAAENPPQVEAPGKAKKSKKKKNPKPKAASGERAVVEHAILNLGDEHNLSFFSPGGKPEEEKESDINDFADLIRMMPPTPAPAKVVEVSSAVEMPVMQESAYTSVASETDKGKAADVSSGIQDNANIAAESSVKKLNAAVSPNLLQLALEISGMEEEPCNEKVQQMMKSVIMTSPNEKNDVSRALLSPATLLPLEPSNGAGSELCAVNNSAVGTVEVDNCGKAVPEESSNQPKGPGGKKASSSRKKKAHKSSVVLVKEKESVSSTALCGDSVTECEKPERSPQPVRELESDKQPKSHTLAVDRKTYTDENRLVGLSLSSNDKQANAHRGLPEPLEADGREQEKAEKAHVNHKEKKSGRTTKKETAKMTSPVEEENIWQNGKHGQPSVSAEIEESKEIKEQGSVSRRGFALSNFLPATFKPFDSQRTDNSTSGKATKWMQPSEDKPETDKGRDESLERVEEATQTVRKELKTKNRDDVDFEGHGKKRHRKAADRVHENIPETLTFSESDIFSIVDKVENMAAAATQTEPKRKSHSRKHKASCDREGPSSKRARKSGDKRASVGASDADKSEPVALVVTPPPVPEKGKPQAQPDHEMESTKRNPMDVFSFEMNDDAGAFDGDLKSFRTPTKKSGKSDSAEKLEPQNGANAFVEVSTSTEKESHGRKSPLAVRLSEPFVHEANAASKYACPGPASKSGAPSKQPPPATASLEVPLPKALPGAKVTEVEMVAGSSASKAVSSDTGACLQDEFVGKTLATESVKSNSLSASARLPASRDSSSTALDVPYSKITEEQKKDSPFEAASGKLTASKAQHMNIASIAGSLAPKGGVTKLSSHAQRNKTEREQGVKDSANVAQETEKSHKNRKEGESETRIATPVVVPSSSAEAPQKPVTTKETVARETVTRDIEHLHASKVDKQKVQRDKEPAAKNDVHAKNDRFNNQESSSASNAGNHYLTSPPVLSQCAYNDTYQKSRTPSTLSSSSSSGGTSSELLPASRSGCSHKSGSMQSSGPSGLPSKMASGYSSAGSAGVDLERKSWQEESRRRNDSDYFASAVPSCAVQNKSTDPYSCSSIFPPDKAGMAHQQADSATNFPNAFGSHSQNPFYPQSSAFGGLNQVSPCSGDSMTRGSMSSCSVDKRSSNAKTGNPPSDSSGAMRRDISKANQRDSYFSSQLGGGQFLEPNASPVLSSMTRDKSSCLGTSMASQTNSRQQVPSASSTAGRNPSQNRSPSVAEQQSPYSALSGYHGIAGSSMATTMLHHPSSMSDYSRYPSNGQHSLGFDMFQSPGTQFNPNLPGLTFDPPPLNVFRDCSSASSQSNGVNKKPTSKITDPSSFDSAAKSSGVSSRGPSHQPSNQSQPCKSGSNRSSTKSSSSSSKKSSKPSTLYGMDSGMFDGRSVTPFIGLGSTGLSPSRTMPPDSLTYFPPPNIFGNTGRTLSNAKTLQHRDAPLPFSPALFSPSRAAQNGLGLNFQTGFGMDHVHGSHIASSQVIPPPPSANAMPAHMHGFGFGNIFSDISGAAQRDPLGNMSPIKFTGGMEASTLHHHHHQAASSMYNGRSQLPAHMLPDMGFNPFLGHQHPGFDARSIGTHFGSHGPAASFGMFPMHNL